MFRKNDSIIELRKDTKVLFHLKDRNEYIMTNERDKPYELLRVFSAEKNGKIHMSGLLLGSIFAHDPYIIEELEKVDCTFSELNPDYFGSHPVVDGLIGLSVGDAFGVPFEFLSRKEVRDLNIGEMVGNDCDISFTSRWSQLIPSGSWSDDTSMTIAAMDAINKNRGRIDYDKIMKQFLIWWTEGAYSSLQFPFGLGGNISKALERYARGVPATECGGTGIWDNGNGALMRMFPFSMYCILKNYDDEETLNIIRNATSITHGHEINVLSCYFYTQFLYLCYRGKNPLFAYNQATSDYEKKTVYERWFSNEAISAHQLLFNSLNRSSFDPDVIPESGYVVDSLTISIYCILHTTNYEDAIRMAVAFGYDTDTNAAITGSIAGVLYGIEQIPERWLQKLRKREELQRIGMEFEKWLCENE